MVEKIDAFGHVVPESILNTLIEEGDTQAAGGLPVDAVEYLREEELPSTSLDGNVEDMDDNGIDKQIVSIQPTNMFVGLDPDYALPLVRQANNEIRDMADEHPNRIKPIATLPFLTGEYVDEFERCVTDLGLEGVQIFSNAGGLPLDDPELRPFYRAVEKHDVPIWIHPTNYAWQNWDNIHGHGLYLVLGWPFETTVAMCRLVLGGVMDEFPDLDIITHHMGGTTSHLAHRISVLYFHNAPDEDSRFSEDTSAGIRDRLSQFYVDTARGGATPVLESGHEFFGRSRMVFGTDYPFGPSQGRWVLREEQNAVEEMDISESDRERIFSSNIRELVDI